METFNIIGNGGRNIYIYIKKNIWEIQTKVNKETEKTSEREFQVEKINI